MSLLTSEIAQAFRQDREAVFRELYERCYPQVRQLVAGMGGNQAEARDIFHDALIIFYEKALAGQLHLQGSPSAYLVGIAKQLWRRQQRQDSHLLSLDAFERQIELPAELLREPARPKLRWFKFLAAAGRRCLDILQAFYYQQMPLRQIADEFGFRNTRSATVQKHKCLEKIRAEVKQKQWSYEEVVA